MTIAEAIAKAAARLAEHGIETARLDAELLLRHVLHKDRAWLLAHGREPLDDGAYRAFQETIGRRVRREPVQYIIGMQEFRGLEFIVTPEVLIPRPETEFVVEACLEAVRGVESPVIIDLCTGSGCIAISLAKGLSGARIFAADRSSEALSVARRNAARHSVAGRIRFLEGDLFDPLSELDIRGRVDAITANPPYIRSGDLPQLQPEVRDYEPGIALIAGPRGTEFHERIIRTAPEYLKKSGSLVMEMGIYQAEKLRRLAEGSGDYDAVRVLKDLAGIERVIAAKKR